MRGALRDNDGLACECLLEAFGARPIGPLAEARAMVGASLILETVVLLRAIVRGLSGK